MEENNSRKRLSIDLDANPDVRDMLQNAIEATGETASALVMEALQTRLPEIVAEIFKKRAHNSSMAAGENRVKFKIGIWSERILKAA